MLPSIARVRVEPARDRIVVVEDVELPRGDWQSGPVDVYVAFGAPGTPMAFDAHLFSAPAEGDAAPSDAGDRVTTEGAVRRDSTSPVVLGRPQMAGIVVRLRESQLRRAFDAGDAAILRLRSLLRPEGTDGAGARDAVVRLGTADGLPLTLRRVEVAAPEGQAPVTRAQAMLCGADDDADPWPLAVILAPGAPPAFHPVIAPEAATRRPSDDLCIRWWTAAPQRSLSP